MHANYSIIALLLALLPLPEKCPTETKVRHSQKFEAPIPISIPRAFSQKFQFLVLHLHGGFCVGSDNFIPTEALLASGYTTE